MERNNVILLSESKAKLILIFAFIILFFCSFILIPYTDSYYYWDWGRHLSLSYIDGPPLIAYLMYFFSFIFGDQTYAINLLGLSSIYITLLFIFKTSELLFNHKIALNACLLWLFSTPVLHYLFFWVTYDNPLNLFWAATIYYAIKYIRYKKNQDIYSTALFSSLMILSKYSGIVLIIALFAFITLPTPYRAIFKNKHFYYSILMSIFICSPIIIWNFQHDWISFSYQFSYHLNTHRFQSNPWEALLRYLFKIIKSFDVLIVLPLYALFKSFKHIKKNYSLLMLNLITFFFVIFFLIISLNNSISKHWLTPLSISTSILCSYYFVKYHLQKLFSIVIIFYILLAIYYVSANCLFQKYFDEEFFNYSLVKEAGHRYADQKTVILTSDWRVASKLAFWLPNKPHIYTLACGSENQYADWSHILTQQLKSKQLRQVLYLDFADRSPCIRKYFKHCTQLPELSYPSHPIGIDKTVMPAIQLYVYDCFVSA